MKKTKKTEGKPTNPMQDEIQIALNELFSIRFDAILAPIEFWRRARLCTMSACYRILGCFCLLAPSSETERKNWTT